MSRRRVHQPRYRVIRMSQIRECPHLIMSPSHYREDGSCKCKKKVRDGR